jgi:nicotinate-nucleotide--dimethylbenzimidazole phosphoribosyltransferase
MNAPPCSWAVAPAADAAWEQGLSQRLARVAGDAGGLGDLEAVALRLGLIQRSLEPRLQRPQLVVAMADHGLATDGAPRPLGLDTTTLLKRHCDGSLPAAALARLHGIGLTVLDVGLADTLTALPGLLARKIAFGTRHARMGPAMTRDQALTALRIGSELSQALPGNVLLCAGLGVGATESAALVLARLTDTPIDDLVPAAPARISPARSTRLLASAQGVLARHPQVRDPVDVLAAMGGFESAALAGLMITAAQARRVIVVDGLPALAALLVASRLAPPVVDYCVFVRSQGSRALDAALSLFRAAPVIELGLDALDGTGAAVAWPLIASATVALAGQPASRGDLGPTTGPAPLALQTEMQFLPHDN